MHFVMGLPKARSKNDLIWVIVDRLSKTIYLIAIVDRLSKSIYLIAIASAWTLDQLTHAYLNEIIHLHGVLSSMVSNRGTRFQAGFWQKL